LLKPFNTPPECGQRVADTDWFPAADVTEIRQSYLLEVDLPGLKPDQAQVNVDDDILSITGERPPRHSGGQELRAERPAGPFVRRFVLPADSCKNEIQAGLVDGVLQLRVPRKTSSKEDEDARAI
jgi:HSP20 family protein